jgi:predicted dinucleotide-binding enzyme
MTAGTGEPLEGDVVVLAVYNPDARAAVEQHADQLAGKVVVDITIRSTRTSTVSCCQPTGRPPRSSRASPQMHGS